MPKNKEEFSVEELLKGNPQVATSEPKETEVKEVVEPVKPKKSVRKSKKKEVVYLRYNKHLAKIFGSQYSITIMPVTYNFQKGWKTPILKEHEEEIWNVFEQKHRASGTEISKEVFDFKDLRKLAMQLETFNG